LQTIVTREQNGKKQEYIKKYRVKAQNQKRQLDDKITTIVQTMRTRNNRGYSAFSCHIDIPKTVCRLAGIHEGSIIVWELSKYESNAFTMRVVNVDEVPEVPEAEAEQHKGESN
jgi:arylsulfatase A-like enzyme